jgi:hypothetical protein
VELPEFADVIPSVENIARVIYKLLQPRSQTPGAAAGCRDRLGDAEDVV